MARHPAEMQHLRRLGIFAGMVLNFTEMRGTLRPTPCRLSTHATCLTDTPDRYWVGLGEVDAFRQQFTRGGVPITRQCQAHVWVGAKRQAFFPARKPVLPAPTLVTGGGNFHIQPAPVKQAIGLVRRFGLANLANHTTSVRRMLWLPLDRRGGISILPKKVRFPQLCPQIASDCRGRCGTPWDTRQ